MNRIIEKFYSKNLTFKKREEKRGRVLETTTQKRHNKRNNKLHI